MWVRSIVTVLLYPPAAFIFSKTIILSINSLPVSGVSFFILRTLKTTGTKLFILSFISSYYKWTFARRFVGVFHENFKKIAGKFSRQPNIKGSPILLKLPFTFDIKFSV